MAAYSRAHTQPRTRARAFRVVVVVGGCNRERGIAVGMAFCGQSSMCLYAVMCYRFLARSPAASVPVLVPDGVYSLPVLSYAR